MSFDSIFLIDHAWTYPTQEQARKHLAQVPGLLQRMMGLMAIKEDSGKTNDDYVESVLREMWRYNQTYSMVVPVSEQIMSITIITCVLLCENNKT